jgi:hypothetical protein
LEAAREKGQWRRDAGALHEILDGKALWCGVWERWANQDEAVSFVGSNIPTAFLPFVVAACHVTSIFTLL